MDNLNFLLQALATGAVAGMQQTASTAIKDAYYGLKALIQRKSTDQQKVATILVEYEEDPDTYEKPLRKVLSASHLDQDEEIISAARELMTLVQPQQLGMGKYSVQNTGNVQGQIIGDHADVTMHFGETS